MNRKFESTSRRTRATFAIAAMLVSLLIGSGIDGLVDHYQAASQMASSAPVVVAQR
jgi:hypothetical protein